MGWWRWWCRCPTAGFSDRPTSATRAELVRIVADWLGETPTLSRFCTRTAEVVPYDLDAITTAGRYWVRGEARTPSGARTFSASSSNTSSPGPDPRCSRPSRRTSARSPEASVPWRTEPLIYRSDLGDRLPAWLTLPRAVAVFDLDEKSAAVWLEEVPDRSADLGPRAVGARGPPAGPARGQPAVRRTRRDRRELEGRPVRGYLEGRLSHQILPMLRGDEVWRHPLVASAFDPELRTRLLTAADRLPAYVEEIERMPIGASHGDACTEQHPGPAGLRRAGADRLRLLDATSRSAST